MAYARRHSDTISNSDRAILIAYDLQAGSYVAGARQNTDYLSRWGRQLADLLAPYIASGASLLEAGCGEATTIGAVMKAFNDSSLYSHGFDISWSRVAQGREWLAEQSITSRLFVADLFTIPMADNSIDIVYTSHSIEPNGGREKEALHELLRVARRAVVLVEPIYELAEKAAKERMEQHGYVRNLAETAQSIGATITDYRLLPIVANPLNPSGVIVLEKNRQAPILGRDFTWQCPLTDTPLQQMEDVMFSPSTGLAYPILRRIPLLCQEHAVVASRLNHEPGRY